MVLKQWFRGVASVQESNKSKRPVLLELRSDRRFIIFTVAVAVFTDIFLYGLVVPVFAFALETRAHIPRDDVQTWISVLLAIYAAGLLVASPICGYIADHTSSRRLPFVVGLLALSIATVLLCIGSSITVFIIGRLFQGISAAVVWTVGLVLLVDTVGPQEVGQAMGAVSVGMSLGILLAPVLGGVVFARGGYYAVFAMAFAVIGVDIALRMVLIEKKEAQKYTEEQTPENSPEAPSEKTVPLPAPVVSDGTIRSPEETASEGEKSWLPPTITLLGHKRLAFALWGSLAQAILMTGLETTIPLFTRNTFHFNSTGAGLVFLAIVVPSFFSPLAGWACDKYGPRWIAAFGFVFGCPFYVLLRLPDEDTVHDIVLLCALLFLIGCALAMILTPFMAEITLVVQELEGKRPGRFGPKGAYAQAYGLFNFAFSGGTLAGPLLSGFVTESAGFSTMAWALGLICFVSAIPTVIYTGGRLRKQDLAWLKRSVAGAQAEEP